MQVDIGDYDSCAGCVEEVQRELGPIDILVNNAAYTFFNPIIGAPYTPLTSRHSETVGSRSVSLPALACQPGLALHSGRGTILSHSRWQTIRPPADYPVNRWHASSAVNFNGMFYSANPGNPLRPQAPPLTTCSQGWIADRAAVIAGL